MKTGGGDDNSDEDNELKKEMETLEAKIKQIEEINNRNYNVDIELVELMGDIY